MSSASLPQSIGSYLREAGFSPTELMVLRKLLEEDALTLREMAAKTGKSTGVLDQATKKLIAKGIVHREQVNGVRKYRIVSFNAIAEWVKRDMLQRRDVLHRRQRDFESFLSSVERESHRPAMEYFEGEDGIMQAYMGLLECGTELLRYVPATIKEEDDPLRPFRADFARECRKRKIFSRVIAQDTPLGRRYQSRDNFEYRKSVLVSERKFPSAFEKVIAGDTVACFNHEEQRAVFIRFPELAATERGVFEVLWTQQVEDGSVFDPVPPSPQPEVGLRTRVLSVVREGFTGRQNLGVMSAAAVTALVLTCGMYAYTLGIMKQEVGERLKSIAATAAPEIAADDLALLRFARDMGRPEYERVFRKLNDIRDRNADIAYAYVLRPTDVPGIDAFVADADSSLAILTDEGGEIEDFVAPGTHYDSSASSPAVLADAMEKPVAEEDFVMDEWGTFLSAYAPIRDADGNAVAMLGVDMEVANVLRLAREQFVPVVWILLSFLMLLFLPAMVRALKVQRAAVAA